MELGYENAPVQQCPIAGAGPEDWSGGGGGGRGKEVEIRRGKGRTRKWRIGQT